MNINNWMAFLYLFFVSCFQFSAFADNNPAEDIGGFWKTIDDKTGKPQSIVATYESEGKYFGRIILTYQDDGTIAETFYAPRKKAPGVEGNPPYAGMDIIWDLQKEGHKYTNGKIIDPQRGAVYDADAWIQNGNLVVRGKILFLGENQTWLKATNSDFPLNFKMPNLKEFKPVIPQAKK